MNTRPTFQLVAHRGNAAEFPENTLPAFRSALELGLRYVEFDVQLSADQVPIVIHDHTLARTTGMPGSVFDHTADELVRIEAAERAVFGSEHQGVCLPRLTEALELICGFPGSTAFVEIKAESLRQFGTELVVGRILSALQPWLRQCVIISFDLPALVIARQHGAQSIGWVLEKYDDHTRFKCEALRPDYLFCDHADLPPAGHLWRGPWRWAIYEVESLPLAARLATQGVALIETMKVRAMHEGMIGSA